MNMFRKSIVIAVASLGLGSVALAASDSGATPTDAGHHWSAFGSHGAKSAERMAKRQAALHDKLNLSSTQETAWKAFTDKLQATAPAKTDFLQFLDGTGEERDLFIVQAPGDIIVKVAASTPPLYNQRPVLKG